FTMPKGSGSVESSEKDSEEIVVPEYRHGEKPPDHDVAQNDEEAEGGPEQAEPGFVRLAITPPDASVYIDGKLFGSASKLAALHGDLRLDGGRHRIEAVRPGYRGVTREVDLQPGDHLSVSLDLERNSSR